LPVRRICFVAFFLAEIQTSRVARKKATKQIRLTGKVEVDQRKVYVQPSHIPGRIEGLSVEFEGEYVEENQPIATIYSPDLIAAQEELLEALRTGDSNPEMVEAARQKLRQWKLSQQQIEAIEEKGRVQEEMTIQADVSGIIHKQMVHEGDYVNKGTRLFKIAQIDRVWVLFDAYQNDIPFVDEGDQIEFTVSSLPGRTFSSEVTFVDPVMNEQSRVASIRAEARNVNGMLKPGMFAEGILQAHLDERGKQLTVPKSAVMWTGERSVVYVRQPNQDKPVFRLRQVVLGPSLGDTYVIREGLSEGEKVVTHGTFAVDAAAQLADKPSMMNQKNERPGPPQQKEQQHSGHTHAQASGQQETAGTGKSNQPLQWPATEKETYRNVVQAYLTLKDQLVSDREASNSASKLLETLQAVEMESFSGQAHMMWMELQNTLKENSRAISETQKIKQQRRHFIALSNGMITLVKKFKPPVDRLYIQFCPMADNDQGATWLSSEEQIRNPYFGDMMLTCGNVREEIEAKNP
jgi:Cu(I)/Ag(I) efflux system membrane fusion protein